MGTFDKFDLGIIIIIRPIFLLIYLFDFWEEVK